MENIQHENIVLYIDAYFSEKENREEKEKEEEDEEDEETQCLNT